ncbi:hypothetical protein AB0B30_32685 [Streptomyces narbonensis]|uniref:Helix-turn-helix DNA binding domain protein n=1 Tax=Streptomyces narbonensis TaxID=67333 RepID=A0ABV3CIU5_9ACTN
MTSTPTPVPGLTTRPGTGTNNGHGSPTWVFTKRCPCPTCRTVKNAYQRHAYRLRGYGQWRPYVDATPSQKHLNALHDAGVSYCQIAEQSGLAYGHVRRIASGRSKGVRAETEQAILALTAESMEMKLLPATGSARRLQALVAIGWPFTSVAPYIGLNERGITRVIHQSLVLRPTAEAIKAAYAQLKDQKPEDHGVSLVGAQKSRALAKRRGWPDPLWWEDMGGIDDPEFDPSAVERPLNFHEQAALRREEIAHLSSFGLGHEEIATRLGMAAGYVRDVLRDMREAAA